MVLGTILTHAKKHPALIPLFVIIGSGGVGAGLYLMRLAMFNPDVSLSRLIWTTVDSKRIVLTSKNTLMSISCTERSSISHPHKCHA
uniref:Cytochrome c oxidase subunit NDUFA4 n=1 Tax=Catharus ustulatus TaxID=91951 RepID=A0A8C3TPN3_CATUS